MKKTMAYFLWILVAGAGAWAYVTLALHRGVPGRSDFVIPRACNLRRQRFERFFSTLFVYIFGLDATFNRLSYSTRGHDGHESHPFLLVLAQRLVEWLPGIGDLLEIGSTLT